MRRSCERRAWVTTLQRVLRRPRPRRHENTILLDKLSKILTREKTAQAGGARLPKVAAPPTAGGGLHDIYRRKVREQIDVTKPILAQTLTLTLALTLARSASRSTARTSRFSGGCST